jgi:hypothetical protein
VNAFHGIGAHSQNALSWFASVQFHIRMLELVPVGADETPPLAARLPRRRPIRFIVVRCAQAALSAHWDRIIPIDEPRAIVRDNLQEAELLRGNECALVNYYD